MKTHSIFTNDNGVYRTPSDVASLRTAAGAAGARWTGIALLQARGKRAVLNAFARSLQFPDSFGGNWDALADCLQDLSWLPEKGWVLALRGAADFAAAKSAEHAVLMGVLGDTAEYWRRHNRVFVVLSDAAGLPAFPRR